MTELISNIKVIRYSMFQNNAAADTDTFSGILFGKILSGNYSNIPDTIPGDLSPAPVPQHLIQAVPGTYTHSKPVPY